MKLRKFLSLPVLGCILAAAMFSASSNSASAAGLKFGIKGGVTVNDFKFNESMFNSENRCGYTVGVMTKFTAPIINIGFDASLMFTHRSMRVESALPADALGNVAYQTETFGTNYLEIPINFRWDIGLPVIGNIVTPFLTTGPDFSFLLSKENVDNAWNRRKFDFAWNFGFGLMFVNKVQLHASYGLGLNNAASADQALYGSNLGDGKNRFWTVTAAYLF